MNTSENVILICSECGAEGDFLNGKCWLCNGKASPFPPTQQQKGRRHNQPDSLAKKIDDVVAGLLALVAVLIGFGIALDDPEGLIGYLILVVPCFALAVSARKRQRRANTTGVWGSKTWALVSGGLAVFGILFGLIIAAVFLLFVTCTAIGMAN